MRLFVSRLSRSRRTIMGRWAQDRSKYMPHYGKKQLLKESTRVTGKRFVTGAIKRSTREIARFGLGLSGRREGP